MMGKGVLVLLAAVMLSSASAFVVVAPAGGGIMRSPSSCFYKDERSNNNNNSDEDRDAMLDTEGEVDIVAMNVLGTALRACCSSNSEFCSTNTSLIVA